MFDNKSVETIFEEIDDAKENELYLALTDSNKVYMYSKKSQTSEHIDTKLLNTLKKVFLPEGFPESVSVDYIPYQIWDTMQAFCSTVTGILSTHAIMAGVGVGNENATPLSATITWILKDGTGHIGRIVFAWWKGSDLDINSKKWRLAADVLNDIALGIELLFLPLYLTWSTHILCLTTAMKAVVGIAGGATRAALTQHHALRGNLADVAAKDGSQETFVNLCSSLLSIIILLITNSRMMAVLWFFLFTVLHLFANYKAVKSIRLKVLNTSRLLITYTIYIKQKLTASVEVVNEIEPVTFGNHLNAYQLCGHHIKLGKSIKKSIGNVDLQNLRNAKLIYKKKQFCINVFKNIIYVSFRKNYTSEDVLQAYFHALVIGVMRSKDRTELKDKITENDLLRTCSIDVTNTYLEIFNQSCMAWMQLKDVLLEAGWSTDQHLLPVGECRADW